MSVEILSSYLSELTDNSQTILMYNDPEIVDFTNLSSSYLVLQSDTMTVRIPLNNIEDLVTHIYMLEESVWHDKHQVICWNIKNLMTYIKFHLPHDSFQFSCALIDLKICEDFLGIKLERPASLKEALQRIHVLTQNHKLVNIYKNIYKPLALYVLPAIECCGIGESINDVGRCVYPYYEIEGQSNGRLRCTQPFVNCINPHTLTKEHKLGLRTSSEDELFLYFDYSHMEVSMLQWLSSDPELGEITKKGQDPYKDIFKTISGRNTLVSDSNRKFAKSLFLPIIYGQQAYSIAEQYNISVKGANLIISRIRDRFSVAINYLDNYQDKLKQNSLAEDYFGRPRYFNKEYYKIRNFLIQAPSAILCLEKLVVLYNSVKSIANIALSIHDGYLLIVNKDNINYVDTIAEEALLSESQLCPGINLQLKKNSGPMFVSS